MDFTDFVSTYQDSLLRPDLFELSLPWLKATYDFMLPAGAELIVHCLFTDKSVQSSADKPGPLLVALPLIHHSKKISSLSSFYSAVTEPLFSQVSFDKEDDNLTVLEYLESLLMFIKQHSTWHQMHIGSIDKNALLAKSIEQVFPSELMQRRIYSLSDNYYQENITDFSNYYQHLPSQLKNTVKRRTTKLSKQYNYSIDIIATIDDFPLAFAAYQEIYQQSWKGEEYSFAFIEQVCRQALAENKLRLALLSIDNEPAAAQIWFVQSSNDKKVASIFKLAYQPKFQAFSVGSILSMALSEYVIEQDNVTSIEFGMGSETYKQDWLVNKRQRISYQVFNNQSLYGMVLAFIKVTLPQIKQSILGLVKK